MVKQHQQEQHPGDVEPLKVIVIGAGIAGLAAARALREHHDVIILERSSLKREVGAAIVTGPNASTILHRWGMIHASLESPVWNATVVRDGLTGKVLSETNMDWDKMPFKVPAYLNHRVALHRELMRLATAHSGQGDEPAIPGNPAELRTSSQAVDIDADTGTVILEDGTKMQADLLVVADGINSSLRSKILGRPHPAQPSGSTAFRLLLPLSALQADPDLTEWTNMGQLSVRFGKGRSIVAYSCRMDGTDLLNVAALCPDDELPKDHLDAGWMAAGEKELMLSVFKDFSPDTRKLLSMAESCGLWRQCDLGTQPLDRWSQGKAILIGDSAHASLPLLGQGGSMAIEDADMLGHVFSHRKRDESIEAALERVFRLREERASFVQRESHKRKDFSGKHSFDVVTDYCFPYPGAAAYEQQVEAGTAPLAPKV